MLFTITREQYQRYSDTAGPCRQYILDKFPRLCDIVETFNRYFGAENVDIYGDGFKEKSLLLTLLEDYEERCRLVPRSITEYLDNEFADIIESDCRDGLFANLAIYVHWPEVTVTNERGQSVVVTDLYAKVPVWPSGRLYDNFMLTRATYPYDQFTSGYLHSHVQGITNDPSEFRRPCLGTGPLIRTQATLSSSTEDLWDLFCVELDRYVHVESIAGVPYRYLSRIGTPSLRPIAYTGHRLSVIRTITLNNELSALFKNFFKYILIRKKMKFSYVNGMFRSSLSDTGWILKLSKEFLKYFALMTELGRTGEISVMTLIGDNLMMEVKLSDGHLYSLESFAYGRGCINPHVFEGRHVLYFKGEDIVAHVDEPSVYNANSYYVLNPVLALTFLDQCLNYLNIYEHEKIQNTIHEESQVICGSSDSADSERSQVKNTFTDYPFGEKRVAISL